MKYAVIDVGSNTVRLCVYDVLCSEKRKFKTIMNRKIMAGLAAYIVDGAFSDEGIAEAILAVKKCIKRASYLSPDRIDVFATAVLRNISNSAQAIAAIEQGAGCSISLLSNADEAHLGFVGASSRGTLDDGALIDIGGGSTEITVIENGIDVARTSLPQGRFLHTSVSWATFCPPKTRFRPFARAFAGLLPPTKRAPVLVRPKNSTVSVAPFARFRK